MGIGYIVRDCIGRVVAAACHCVESLVEPAIAEALAALRTNEFCRNRGFLYIVLEGDSSIVVNAINKGGLRWSIYGQILADIQGLVVCFHSWSMCHTRRGANNAAHFLAKEGLKYATTRNWVKCVPDCIAQVVFTVYRDQFSGHLELLGF
jgi:ribonuclease HI